MSPRNNILIDPNIGAKCQVQVPQQQQRLRVRPPPDGAERRVARGLPLLRRRGRGPGRSGRGPHRRGLRAGGAALQAGHGGKVGILPRATFKCSDVTLIVYVSIYVHDPLLPFSFFTSGTHLKKYGNFAKIMWCRLIRGFYSDRALGFLELSRILKVRSNSSGGSTTSGYSSFSTVSSSTSVSTTVTGTRETVARWYLER